MATRVEKGHGRAFHEWRLFYELQVFNIIHPVRFNFDIKSLDAMSILFETNHPSVPAVAFAILGLVAYGLLRVLSDPLRKVPGPWLARWTRLWEFQKVREGHMEQVNLDLHKQYGP